MIDPLILARSVHFAASLLAAGTVLFVMLVANPAAYGASGPPVGFAALCRRWTWLTWTALAVAVLSGAAWLVLLASDILGAPIADVCLRGSVWSVLTDTRFGQVWSARAALALLLTALLPWPRTRWLQLTAAAGLIALPALIGHAGATPATAGEIHLVSDIVHLLAAGAWLGGLPALAMLLARARNAEPSWRDFAIRATGRFSGLGLISVGALLASGIVNSWNLLSGPGDLLSADYGRLLLLKIGLFVAMVGIAAVNKFHLTPQLSEPAAMRSLQRNVVAETSLGLGVLLFVGALGTMAPAAHRHMLTTADIPSNAAFVHIHSSEAMADVTIDPGRAGRSRASIRVSRENFSEFPAKSVRLDLASPTTAVRRLARSAVRMPDGTWQIDAIDLVQPGIWTVRVIVAPEAGAPIVLDAPVVIER